MAGGFDRPSERAVREHFILIWPTHLVRMLNWSSSSGAEALANKSSFFSPPASLCFNIEFGAQQCVMLTQHAMQNCIHIS